MHRSKITTTFFQYCEDKTAKINRNKNSSEDPINYYSQPPTGANQFLGLFQKRYALTTSGLMYRRGNSRYNYNGFGKDNNNEKIACRQLAYAWLYEKALDRAHKKTASEAGKSTGWRKKFGSIKDIEAQPLLAANLLDSSKLLYKSDESHEYDPDKGFGGSLYEVVKDIEIGKTKSMLFGSEYHAMGIEVSYKSDPERIVLEFYDPNNTQSSVRIVVEKIEDLKSLKLEDVILKRRIAEYFPNVKSGIFAVYNNPIGLANNPRMTVVTKFHITPNQNRLSEQLYFALEYNNFELVTTIINMILSMGGSDQDKTLLLEAKLGDYFGLMQAFYRGHTNAVTAYLDAILKSNLPDPIKLKLLKMENKDRESALLSTWKRGRTDFVIKYLEALQNPNLSQNIKNALLSVRRFNDTLFLYMSLYKLIDKSLPEYFTYIVYDTRSNEYKQYCMLSMADSNGKMFLHSALLHSNADIITTYLEAILNSNLDKNIKFRLLLAKDVNGIPVLHAALYHGSINALTAYLKAILNSNLDESIKLELLLAKDLNGRFGISQAIKMNCTDAVNSYMLTVLGSDKIADVTKKELLVYCI